MSIAATDSENHAGILAALAAAYELYSSPDQYTTTPLPNGLEFLTSVIYTARERPGIIVSTSLSLYISVPCPHCYNFQILVVTSVVSAVAITGLFLVILVRFLR
jgi:hypothetical protein